MDADRPRRRIEAGPILAGAGAVLLLVALFLEWYDGPGTAWEVFEVWDVILAVLALLTLYSAFEEVAGREPLAERLLLLTGIVALVIVVSQVINDPPAAADAGKGTGIWLAVGGSVLMALGGLLSSTHLRRARHRRPPHRGDPRHRAARPRAVICGFFRLRPPLRRDAPVSLAAARVGGANARMRGCSDDVRVRRWA